MFELTSGKRLDQAKLAYGLVDKRRRSTSRVPNLIFPSASLPDTILRSAIPATEEPALEALAAE